jgi:hypothetical protein
MAQPYWAILTHLQHTFQLYMNSLQDGHFSQKWKRLALLVVGSLQGPAALHQVQVLQVT